LKGQKKGSEKTTNNVLQGAYKKAEMGESNRGTKRHLQVPPGNWDRVLMSSWFCLGAPRIGRESG